MGRLKRIVSRDSKVGHVVGRLKRIVSRDSKAKSKASTARTARSYIFEKSNSDFFWSFSLHHYCGLASFGVALYVCASRLQQHLAMSLPFRVFVLQMTMKLLIQIRESSAKTKFGLGT